MLYQLQQGKIHTNSIEYSVSYHCNLRCVQCSHLSPFANAHFPSIDSFREDLFRLSEVLHAKVIRLLGGEPLLNPDIDRYIAIARQSGIADSIMVTTNGLLLHRMSDAFWENLDNVLVCLYPEIALKETYGTFRKRAEAHHTRLWFQIVDTFRTTIVSAPQKKDWITAMIFRSCRDAHFFHCHMIHEGMLYKCAVPPFLPCYLARTQQTYDPRPDGFVIHGQSELNKALQRYLADRRTTEACRYCLGYLGKRVPHRQLPINDESGAEDLPVTRQNSMDYRKLYREAWDYVFRRAEEKLTGKAQW